MLEPEHDLWAKEHLLPHEGMLRAWLSSRFSKGVDIDDVVQESYLRVLKARENNEIKAPKAFLFATARNYALNTVRSAYVRGDTSHFDLDESEILDNGRDVAETIARNQELEILTKAIQSLPDRCRQIFTLRKVYGMTQREIAKKLGISARTVNAQITIGINKCMGFVESYRGE